MAITLFYGNTRMAAMLDVTDRDILEVSSGEVSRFLPANKTDSSEDHLAHTLLDPKIFPSLDRIQHVKTEEELRKLNAYGHIELPVKIVNVQYLYGRKPILSELTGQSEEILEGLLYGGLQLSMTDDDWRIEKESMGSFRQENGLQILKGAEAIDALLKKANAAERDWIILTKLPVLPLSMQHYFKEFNGHQLLCDCGIFELYNRLLNRVERYRKLEAISAPDMILSHERVLIQKAADALISNAANGYIWSTDNGRPVTSMDEICRRMEGHLAIEPGRNSMTNPNSDLIWEKVRAGIENDSDENALDEELNHLIYPSTATYLDTNNPDLTDRQKKKVFDAAFEDLTPVISKAALESENLGDFSEICADILANLEKRIDLVVEKRLNRL